MIKLRLIGSSADLRHLVYSNKKTGKKGSHLVAIDDDLFDVLEDVVRRRRRGEGGEDEDLTPQPVAPRVESKLAPREVQRQLRAGRSPEQVAKAASVPIAWVEQFLVPVLYERQGMVREAQRAWLGKQRLGNSGLPLGDAVEANLLARRVRLTDEEMADAWDATRVEGQPWTITLKFRYRGREQKATWKYDAARRTVVAANRLAADLGWIAPGKRVRTPERTSRFVSPEPPGRRSADEPATPARKRPAKKKAAARKKPAAKKPARKKAPAKRAAAKKRTPAKKRTAAKRTAARRPAAKKRAPAKKRTAARRPAAKKRAPAKKRTAARRPAKKRAPARRRARR